VRLRYYNAAGAWRDGSIGEDWAVTVKVPLLMKAALGLCGPLGLRDGLPDTGPDRTATPAEAHVTALENLEGEGETTALEAAAGAV
jgi:hypothetical protein